MFYKHLHDPSCDLFMHGEEAPQSKEAQLQAALDAEREQSLRHVETAMALRQQLATFQAQQNGVQQKYWQLVNDFNDQKIMLDDTQAQLRQAEGERDTLNQMLRDRGLGQGEIDRWAADCDELSTLRQLVEALINTWVNGRKIHDGIPLTLRQQIDATLAAKDAGKVSTSIIGKQLPPSQWDKNAGVRGDIS